MNSSEVHKGIADAILIHIGKLRSDAAKLRARVESVEHAREDFDLDSAVFSVRINDRSAMYAHTVEQTTVAGRGLSHVIEKAETEHAARYGNLRFDGVMDYRVTLMLGVEDISIPPEVWHMFTKQSLDSIMKARGSDG